MFRLVLAVLLISFSLSAIGQEPGIEVPKEADDTSLRKQILVADYENRISSIPYAAIRVCSRFRLAAWLWKDGKDDTGRAEEITLSALEDYYKNKDEITPLYSCHSQLFVLLDTNAKDSAKAIRAKYGPSNSDESMQLAVILGQADGEKRAVDAALALLLRAGDGNPDLMYLMLQLQQRNSSELNRLLGVVVAYEETGRIRFPAHIIEMFGGFILTPKVPGELKQRFIRLVVARAMNVALLTVPEQGIYFRLIQSLMPEISSFFPEILGEAGTALAILGTRVGRTTREAQERNERINNSSDRLAATVAEAERASEESDKFSLYTVAARLALREGKFTNAVDLMEKASEFYKTDDKASEEFQISLRHQFYRDVITAALKANSPDAANYTLKRLTRSHERAEAFSKIATFYVDGGNLTAGRDAHDEAIKILSRIQGTPGTIATLLKMIPVAQTIDPSRVFELNRLISRSINNIPNLNVEDRSDTANYREYVNRMILINASLFPVISALVKENRNAAEDLASRIDKKEVRLIADFVVLTNRLVSSPETE